MQLKVGMADPLMGLIPSTDLPSQRAVKDKDTGVAGGSETVHL